MQTSLRVSLIVIALPLLTAACSTGNKVRVDKAPNATLACRTFDWRRVSDQPESFTEQRVREAALKELESKGYSHTSDKPDCQITYAFDLTDKKRSTKPSVGVGVGGGSGGMGGGIGISLPIGKPKQPGEFALDVIDAKSNAQIWHGAVASASKNADLTAEEAQSLVAQVLDKFPSYTH